ncbi:MAG: hypothetical protein HAW62_06180 [Endozoicomonadaceae bacterium]|nr:hypothetical protein [Endozoicomonadaceae bacterium]
MLCKKHNKLCFKQYESVDFEKDSNENNRGTNNPYRTESPQSLAAHSAVKMTRVSFGHDQAKIKVDDSKRSLIIY